MIPIFTENPTAPWRRSLSLLGATMALGVFTMAQPAVAQEAVTWAKMTNQPTFNTDTALLLTDGRVFVHQYNSNLWWTLTPDINGSYFNGTWTQMAGMQTNFKPLYFASAVLPDGRVIVEGGEYNNLSAVWTNLGAIYDPATNVWTPVNPPAGWANIGDSPGIVQADGVFMMGQGGISTKRNVLFNASNLTWTAALGTGKSDTFSEEGFGLLPDGRIMVVDCQTIPNSETYNTTTQAWTTAGNTPVTLPDAGSLEVGPQLQRPNGTLVAFGGTSHTAIWTFATNSWAAGPDYPNGNDSADGPAAVLPDGNILLPASPGVFQGHITFFTFDGTAFTQAPATQSSGALQSWQTRLLVLPTGEVMYVVADGNTKDVEFATSNGRPVNAWRPQIKQVPATLTRGTTVQIAGRQFNGLTVGTDYGDDATNMTNYPIVRITNTATHHVFYGKTHDHSTMAIATGMARVSTMFDVPANAETGPSMIEVVANGIGSKPRPVTVQ
jgi:hypothetical protein